MKCKECKRKLSDWNELTKNDLYRVEIGISYNESNKGLVLCCNNPHCARYQQILIKGFDFNCNELCHKLHQLSIKVRNFLLHLAKENNNQ